MGVSILITQTIVFGVRTDTIEALTVATAFMERLATRLALTVKFEELYENAFETFFHDLMSVRYKDFGDVRTAGNLGDMGSGGHSFYNGKLYACYAPQVFNKDKLKEKFDGDLAKAKAKRDGQFEIFVFVHNEAPWNAPAGFVNGGAGRGQPQADQVRKLWLS
jgi:hypothetical protein